MTNKTAPAIIDLSDIQPASSVGVTIKHPASGESVGLIVNLRSMDSPEVQKVGRAIRTKANKLALRQKAYTAEEEEENSIEIITAAITGWTWEDHGSWKGEKPAFTPAIAKQILKVPFIRAQLDSELGDTAQFFR